MIIFVFQLLILRTILCEETSSFLSNVLTKIQRERLGLLHEEFENYSNDDNAASDTNNDYFYVNDGNDVSDDSFKDYHNAGDLYNQETKTKTNFKSVSSLPVNDQIFIYNDTIYLYKAPNISAHSMKPGGHGAMNSMSQSDKIKFGMVPHKMKMKHPGTSNGALEITNPEDLLNIVFTEDEETEEMTTAPPEGDEEEIGYYYKYYPLDEVPPELATLVMNMGGKGKPIKPGMVIKAPKKPMPMKPGMMMMKKKKKQPVGPLFKAMAVFVGTAVMFIATILLLPRVKLVKAKSNAKGLGFPHMYDDDAPWDLTFR